MAPLQISQLLILILCFVKKSYQKCDYRPNKVFCDSLQDLYENSNLEENVEITQRSDPETLQPVPHERAKDIKYLEIREAINNLPKDSMKNFTKLEKLVFFSNKIKIIHKETIKIPHLDFLLIERCNIKTIESEAFSNLPNLEVLRLGYNNLTEIKKNIFTNLGICLLYLSHNQISKIEKSAFENLPNLEYLSLSNNYLTIFNVPDFLRKVPKLKVLWLQQNKISEITNYMLEGLSNLQHLDLNFNTISRIEPKSFEQTPKLEKLLLSYNLLKILDGAILPTTGLQKLETLSLGHNRLMYLSSSFLFRLNSLNKIIIGGNPWNCPCLDLVLRWLYDNNVDLDHCEKDFFSGKRPICIVPNRHYDVCVYSYYEKNYQLFQTHYKTYPVNDSCSDY